MRTLALIAILIYSSSAAAVGTVLCTSGNIDGQLSIDPSAPESTQTITLTVGRPNFEPESVSVEIQGPEINVTLAAGYLGSPSPPPECAVTTIGPLAPGRYTVNLYLSDTFFSPPSVTLIKTLPLNIDAAPLGALSGMWWNPSESGWGINFTQRGPIVFAAWYTYDSSGKPKWYVAPRCVLPFAAPSGTCTESIYEVNGPTFFKSSFDPSAERVVSVGTMTLDFGDSNHGSMSYLLGSNSRSVAIVRQPLPTSSTLPEVDYTGLWWNPNESGWGLTVTQSSNVMFLAWYVYDDAGAPRWYVASNCNMSSGGTGCKGALYSTTGPAFGKVFSPSEVQVSTVGDVELDFADAGHGTLTYTVNGVRSSKAISRELF